MRTSVRSLFVFGRRLRMWTNQYDYVVARSQESAEGFLITMMYGKNWAKLSSSQAALLPDIWGYYNPNTNHPEAIYRDEVDGDGWVQLSDDAELKVYDEDAGTKETKTAREWVNEWGEGYFFSTDV